MTNQNLKVNTRVPDSGNAYTVNCVNRRTIDYEAPQKDTSFTSAFMSGIDRPLENIGTTLQATGVAPEFGQTLRDATQAPHKLRECIRSVH